MFEYEREYLEWEKRQLVLREKYADTPPGLAFDQARGEEGRLASAWVEYERRKEWRITSGTRFEAEPFVGRKEEIRTIRDLFTKGVRTIFLSGMGGIGKSALARAYGRDFAEEYDEVLWWSYDKDMGRILADDGQLGISNLIYVRGVYRSRKRYALEKYQKLLQIASTRRLLIVLDNFNQLEDSWFPKIMDLPCDLLVTTRLDGTLPSGRGRMVVKVRALSRAEDWRAFYQVYTGAYPKKRDWETFCSCREAVLGHTLKMKLVLCNPNQDGMTKKTACSLLQNFRLRKSEIQILCELSFVTLLGIWEEVYLRCTKEDEDALQALKNCSMVSERTDTAGRVFLFLHPVIAEAVETTWHPDVNGCFSFLLEFAYYIRHSWNRPREEDLWLMSQVVGLLKRLPKPVARRFYLYECLATYLFEWEYFEEAGRMEHELYECVKAYYGEIHQFTAQMAMRVAAIYHNNMQFEESIEWYELGYRLYQEATPVNASFYADKAEACEKLARIYEHDGEYEAAFFYTQEAVQAMRVFLQEAEQAAPRIWLDRRMRMQYVYLRRARLYFGQDNLEAARRDLEEAVKMFPLNPFQQVEFRMLQIRIDLLCGNYEEAKEFAVKNLEVSVYYQGESVKDSLSCREQLGDVLSALGDLEAANLEYVRVLSCLQEKYPHQTAWMGRLRQKIKDRL